MKTCTKCNTPQPLEAFGKFKQSKDELAYWCKQCYKIYREQNKKNIMIAKAKHYSINKEKILEKCKEDYLKYKNRVSIYNERYSKENRDKINKKKRATYRINPENKLALNAKYRANKISSTPEWLTKKDYDMIKEFYKETKRLEKETGTKYHVDHIIPLSKGGLHIPKNLQVLTAIDNIIKGDSCVAI